MIDIILCLMVITSILIALIFGVVMTILNFKLEKEIIRLTRSNQLLKDTISKLKKEWLYETEKKTLKEVYKNENKNS